jgi:protein-tyrosine phosphatase
MGFVDLHSHVLPGLDDGSRALSESVELTRTLAGMGFDAVCATPHQRVGFFVPSRVEIDGAYDNLRTAMAGAGVELTLHLGAENFWDELFLGRSRTGAQPTYTGGRAFLVEIATQQTPPRFEDTLFQMRIGGLLPVLAHPERYAPLWSAPERVAAIARTAALVVDLGALDGAHGARECTAARQLVKDGVAHAVATDVHGLPDVRAAASGIAWIRKKLGDAAVRRLLEDNPRRILQGELPD